MEQEGIRAIISILAMMSVIIRTEAALGGSCTTVGDCGYDGATCDGGQCGCDTAGGYRVENNQCLPNVPAVNLTGPSSIVFGQDAVYTASVTSDPVATDIVWQKVSGGATTNITIDGTNTLQTGTLAGGSVTLTIKSVTFDDKATYQVMVSNSVGQTTSDQLALDVTGDPPTVGVSGPTQSGTSVTIVCIATVVTSVSPAITAIQWTKDNTAIDITGSGGKYTGGSVSTPSLTITSIATTDKGDYRCIATNLVGSTTSTFAVTLASPTVSITGASSVLYGNAVTFSGTVNSDLPWTAQKWQKVFNNGTVVDINMNGGKYSGSSLASPNPKLQISNTDFTDEAKYQLVVSNGVGRATSNQVSLDVTGDSPTVALSGDSTVVFGSGITFTGTITSSPPASLVTWQKVDGSQTVDLIISNQKYLGSSVSVSSPRLVINNAAFTDMAIYQLTVTNLVGKKTSNNISLTVTGEKPVITINPSSAIVSVVYGKTATLTATVTTTSDSPPTLNGVWQKQMSGVFTDIDIVYDKYKGSTNDISGPILKINNAVYTDEGAYRFAASNLVGATVSSPRILDVKGTHPTVTILANPYSSIQFGTTLNITASVTANPPANLAKWQRRPQNGAWSDIDISDVTYVGSSDTPGAPFLVISSITYSEDNAAFRCVAGNAEGSTTSNEITMDVTGNLPTVSVTPGGPVQLPYGNTLTPALVATVTAGSNTEAAQEVRWRKITSGNEEIIDISSSKYSGSTNALTNPQLVINNAVFGDEAEYQCQARNAEGWGASNKVSVDVTGGTLTVTIGPAVTGKVGESATISCTVSGPEISQVTWKRGGADFPNDGRYTGSTPDSPSLIINNVVMQDGGQYQCTASNPGGTYSSSTSAALTVINRQFQDSCNMSLPCDSSKDLECSQQSKCVCKEAFYHNNKQCYPSDRLKVTITSHSSTTSTFTVSWNHPSNDVNLVKRYIVRWRIHDQAESTQQSQTVDSSLVSHTVSTGLIPGQLYIVYVTSDVTLTNPASSIDVRSDLEYIRIVPLPPGSILGSSDFAADKLMLSWTPPINNTVVTKYEVTIDRTPQSTVGSNANIQFIKQLIPGTTYTVSIVTVSGQNINNDEDKRSVTYTEEIRTTPTKPGAPTNVICPAEPKDKSLEISWTATATPNGRIVKYIITVSGAVIKTVDTQSNVNTFDVTGLLEERTYTFTVKTVNDAVDSMSSESTPVTCQTKAGLSTPPTALTIGAPSSRGFPVSFGVPTDVKGQLAGYRILIKDASKCWQQIKIFCNTCSEFTSVSRGCISSKMQQVPNLVVTQNYSVTDLHPYINYTFEVAAINGGGVGNNAEKTIMTEQEVPQKPSISAVTPKSDKAVDLTWTLAPPSPGNVTYTVTVKEAEDNTSDVFIKRKEIQYYGFEHTVKLIDGLEEFWRYKFTVKAATITGSKTSDESTVSRTKQGVPGKVRDLTVARKPNTYRAALVQWKVPSLRDQNGILKNYKFISNATGFTDKLVPVDTNEQHATTEEIIVVPETTYSVEIYAINSEGTNGEKETLKYTAEAGPPPSIPDEDIVQTTRQQNLSSLATIEIGVNTDFFKNRENGEPVYFGIAACASCGNANFAGNGQQEYKDLPNWYTARTRGFPLYRVTNWTYIESIENTRSRRRKRSSIVSFVIGEDNACESQGADAYCNGPLSPGLSYTVIVFVCTNGGCTKSGDIGPFTILQVRQEEHSTPPAGAIVGSITGVTIVAIVLVVAIFIWRSKKSELKEDSKTYADLTLHDRSSSDQTYSSLDQRTRIRREKPIRLQSFVDHVRDLMKDSRLKICNEFSELLRSVEKGTTTEASSRTNIDRNRGNVLPYDSNRVHLQEKMEGSDYINASFVLNQSYIMTQYPLPKTAGHFWRMVWEQNCPSIVALTANDKKYKEEWYFPVTDGAVRTVGGIDVELVATFNVLERVALRKIKLSKGKQLKNVNHFHVHDLEMVNMSEQLLDRISLIASNSTKTHGNGPYVVHGGCVGVDYSGVFVLVDYLVKLIESGVDSIDVYGSTFTLMSERMDALTTEEQYAVIYTCLKRYINNKARPGEHHDVSQRNDAANAYEYLP